MPQSHKTRGAACAALGGLAFLAPCHTVPLALSLGLGLSGASAVAAGLYVCAALAVASVAGAWVMRHTRPVTASVAGLAGMAFAASATVQYFMPPRAEAIELTRIGVPYQLAETVSICSQPKAPQ